MGNTQVRFACFDACFQADSQDRPRKQPRKPSERPSGASVMASSSGVILDTAVEIIGVGLLALLAGASDDTGKLMVVFMTGLWAVFMVTHPDVISKIASFPAAAQKKG